MEWLLELMGYIRNIAYQSTSVQNVVLDEVQSRGVIYSFLKIQNLYFPFPNRTMLLPIAFFPSFFLVVVVVVGCWGREQQWWQLWCHKETCSYKAIEGTQRWSLKNIFNRVFSLTGSTQKTLAGEGNLRIWAWSHKGGWVQGCGLHIGPEYGLTCLVRKDS